MKVYSPSETQYEPPVVTEDSADASDRVKTFGLHNAEPNLAMLRVSQILERLRKLNPEYIPHSSRKK